MPNNVLADEAEVCDTIVSLAMPTSMKASLRRLARERDESMSALVRQLLARELSPNVPAAASR